MPQATYSIPQLIKGFWSHFSSRRKRQLVLLMLLNVIVALSEVVSLGAIIPFLSVMVKPDQVFEQKLLTPLFLTFNIQNPQELFLPVTALFIVASVVSGIMRLSYTYISYKIAYAIGADLSYDAYRKTLYQPYSVHIARNTSTVLTSISKVDIFINLFLNQWILLISNTVIVIALVITLVLIDPWISMASFLGFGLIYVFINWFSRNLIGSYSKRTAENLQRVTQLIQEGLGGIRDVLLDGSQELLSEQYRKVDRPRRHAQAGSAILGASPRFIIESIAIVLIALIAYSQSDNDGISSNTINTLGALAIGAQRILPILHRSYQCITDIMSNLTSTADALELLNQPTNEQINKKEIITFNQSIELKKVNFHYHGSESDVLHNIDLSIPKGHRIGFIGTTGSGKSTLIDILLGLLEPTDGNILIDNVALSKETIRSWQKRIAHVPQAIYLADVSIAENIAFGKHPNDIDIERVKKAAEQAQIAAHIETLPEKYHTHVGERGVKFSGGQRQRIGLARAFYKQAEVLILDEATSALDHETETQVMNAIHASGQNTTLIMIAHRLTTLEHCDQIIELEAGQIVRRGNYKEMVG